LLYHSITQIPARQAQRGVLDLAATGFSLTGKAADALFLPGRVQFSLRLAVIIATWTSQDLARPGRLS